MKLTNQNKQKAIDWLLNNARPLEQALYHYHFEDGAAEAVVNALAAFQNVDGGFGHGLESDVRLPDSSVYCTTVALQRMREIKLPSEHPMVVGALNYLLAQQTADGTWRNVPDNVSDAPHAPWWSADGDHTAANIANPSAEIVGYLFEHGIEERREILVHFLGYFNKQLKANAVEMHEIFCFQRLIESPNVPNVICYSIMGMLRQAIEPLLIEPGSGNYGLLPLDVAAHPDSAFADMLGDRITADLANRVTQQHDDGYWQPPWSWEPAAAWATAEQEWRGVITLKNLLIFKNYNWC